MHKATPCPKCHKRPRRRPGGRCTPCAVQENGAGRQKLDLARRVKREEANATPKFTRELKASKRYIITAAQNNTRVQASAWATLKVAAAHLKAEIIVVPYRYKNPTGMQPGRDLRAEGLCGQRVGGRCILQKGHEGAHNPDELWWDPAVEPYLLNQRLRLNPNLVLAADVKIQATASDPLSGFEALTGAESCIVGHPKLALTTAASFTYPKILTTTGSITRKNYSNTKAGALGEFHHTIGATLVEIEEKEFWLRQLLFDERNGSCYDLATLYSEAGVIEGNRVEAVLTGDTHVRITDPDVDHATFGPGGIFEVLRPLQWVVNDLHDGETTNPHEEGDLFISAAKQKAGRQDVAAELKDSAKFIKAREHLCDEVVIVHSNHDDFLRRWVVKTMRNGCHDAKNARTFLETALYMYESAQMTPGGAVYGDPFVWWLKRLGISAKVRCLGHDESFRIKNIQTGGHGHHGPNGAFGGMKNLARIGEKVFDAHDHTPGIFEGHWKVGTSTPRRQAYHRGPGRNLNTHGVIYPNGKRCLITIIGRRWRMEA